LKFEDKIKSVTTPLPGAHPSELIYQLSVKLKFDGYTLLDMYAELFPHQSKDKWEQKILEGSLTVNQKNVLPTLILKAGWITKNKVINKVEPSINPNIKLIFENDDFIVIDKPAPLPIHPAGRFYKNTLTEILKLAFPNTMFKIVHRIDANTTGLVVLAKNKQTAHLIIKQFECQTLKKEYIALVEGFVTEKSFVVANHISKHKTKAGGREIVVDGIKAETVVNVVEYYENSTLLSIQPKSGRTNQIRLHLASIGHPIIGDLGYKDSTYFENKPLTYPEDCLFLHAHKLQFNYNNKQVEFVAKLPNKYKLF
jgi:23S rRNA pseudouridine1911/1915/1917 synthase